MATTARNVRCRNIFDSVGFGFNKANTAFNEGDIMIFDDTTKLMRPIAAAGEEGFVIGDALTTYPVAHHPNWKPDNHGNVNTSRHTVKLIAGEAAAFTQLAPVYFGGDAQTFVLTKPGASTVPLGYVLLEPAEYMGSTVGTTVLGREYEILLRDSYIFNVA